MRGKENTCTSLEITVERDSFYSFSHLCTFRRAQVFLHLQKRGLPPHALTCHLAQFVILALKTDSSFLSKSSTHRGVLLWWFQLMLLFQSKEKESLERKGSSGQSVKSPSFKKTEIPQQMKLAVFLFFFSPKAAPFLPHRAPPFPTQTLFDSNL